MSDHELLQAYARERSQAAFATLVQRHLDLVYSAALRQVRSHRAEEVAQSVFIELARRAPDIAPAQPLAAWLYVVTRRTALNAIREESRRLARETVAAEIAAMKTPSPGWSKIADSLDEAMETLNETERTAVVLRFFQNLSLREVGAALGVSEDTAQKRVSRALERLRAVLLRRGVAVTAAGLATDLSAHTLQIAPAALGPAITHAATLTTVVTSAVALETARLIVMTTAQKYLVATAFVVAGGVGVYESTLAARQATDFAALHAQSARTEAELRALRADRDRATSQLQGVERQIDARLAQARGANPADTALTAQMAEWLGRVERIKQVLVERPELSIPELKHLREESWFQIAGDKPFASDEDLRRALANLRQSAETPFSLPLSEGLKAYVMAHDGMLPASPHELAPYIDPPIERAILDRYEMLRTGKFADVPRAEQMRIMAPKSPPDPEFDSYSFLSPNGHGRTAVVGVNVMHAWQAFVQTNPGQQPTAAAQLKPFLKWPMRDEVVQQNLERMAPYFK